MSIYRLETIDPVGGNAGGSHSGAERAVITARDEGYQAGYTAGYAAATEAFLEEQGRLTSELVEALSDAGMTNEAARRHVAASLAPMIEAIGMAIAPALGDAGLVPEIGRLVARAIDSAPDARPRIRCSPELAPTLEQLVRERGITADIDPVPELLPREAEIVWDQGYDHIDIEACVARIKASIAAHLTQESERDEEDERRRHA